MAAATIGSTWSGRRKPTIAPSTAGLRSVHAIGDRARARAVALGDEPNALDEGQVFGEPRIAELRAPRAPVVVGKRLDPLTGHRPAQQARAHRRVDDHADALALGEGQDLVLDLTCDERVRRLERLDGRGPLDTAELLDAEVGDADVAREPFAAELDECRPALLDLLVGDRPVDLVQVDGVEAQPLEASLELAPEPDPASDRGASRRPAPPADHPW